MNRRWHAYARKTATLEAFYNPKMRKVIQNLYSSFLSDLKQHGLEQAKSNLNQYAIDENLLNTLHGIYEKAGSMGARLTYRELTKTITPREKTLRLIRNTKGVYYLPKGELIKVETKAGFGKNSRWIAAVLRYLQLNLYEFAAAILNTTREDILALLEKGLEQGLGIDQIVALFRGSTRPVSRTRLIVRTEINRAANVGHTIGAQDFPFEVNKKWIAARDHRTRDSHRLVNNHVTSETGTFDVPIYKGFKPTGQVDKMQAPGDPAAHVSNTANCRCRVIFEPALDAQGNKIPRSGPQAVVIPLSRTTAQIITPASIAAQGKALANAIVMEAK